MSCERPAPSEAVSRALSDAPEGSARAFRSVALGSRIALAMARWPVLVENDDPKSEETVPITDMAFLNAANEARRPAVARCGLMVDGGYGRGAKRGGWSVPSR